jgi:hypothetical protein
MRFGDVVRQVEGDGWMDGWMTRCSIPFPSLTRRERGLEPLGLQQLHDHRVPEAEPDSGQGLTAKRLEQLVVPPPAADGAQLACVAWRGVAWRGGGVDNDGIEKAVSDLLINQAGSPSTQHTSAFPSAPRVVE